MIYQIPYNEYCALPGIRASDLKHLKASKEEFLQHMSGELPGKKSKSMDIGSVLHGIILEDWHLGSDYAVYESRRSGKEWKSFQGLNPGKPILSYPELTQVFKMATSVQDNKLMMSILEGTERETSFTFDINGVACKARVDFYKINDDGKCVLGDLKTTRCCQKDIFIGMAYNYGYPLAAAFYAMALEACLDVEVSEFKFLCVENNGAFNSQVFTMGADKLEIEKQWIRDQTEILQGVTNGT